MTNIAVVDAEALERLTLAVEDLTAIGRARAAPVPAGCREDIGGVAICLTLPTWEQAVTTAGAMSVDLRDLNETEVAHLERVKVRTVQRWRAEGTGPHYRNEGCVRYPVRKLWEWRRKGEQQGVNQGRRRGRRPE
jgi:hypothetical protein